MKCIVGLGNPGKKFENTRHNVGFMVIDRLADQFTLPLTKEKFKGMYSTGVVNGEKVLLVKPLTYMNVSGECIRPFLDFYQIPVEDLVVIYDDLDLPAGKIRLRQKGSAGGHNGVKSTIQHLGTQDFKRIRIGIDRPQNGISVPDYVLQRFSKEESTHIGDAVNQSADACTDWLNKPFIEVMNTYN
jgi:peptidyl-tRNA hydrolase, PTH1 family